MHVGRYGKVRWQKTLRVQLRKKELFWKLSSAIHNNPSGKAPDWKHLRVVTTMKSNGKVSGVKDRVCFKERTTAWPVRTQVGKLPGRMKCPRTFPTRLKPVPDIIMYVGRCSKVCRQKTLQFRCRKQNCIENEVPQYKAISVGRHLIGNTHR